MSIEASLTRDLHIRFIDARAITNEARIRCGIEGYPTREQQSIIQAEAIKIFQEKPETEKDMLRRMNYNLELIKSNHSGHSNGSSSKPTRRTVGGSETQDESESSSSDSASTHSRKGWFQRRFSNDDL